MNTKILGFMAAMVVLTTSARASLTPVDLRCDYAVDPLGVDSATPRLFWKVESNERGQRQTAYEIVVKDVWDSGKIASDQTTGIPFPATGLKSNEQFFWKVRVWDVQGQVSDWSPTATWTMGVLSTNDWPANWIRGDTNFPSTLLRRDWVVKPGLKRALINVCGLGQYELTVNGRRVGDDWLSPGWSKYDRTCLYDTRDITSYLATGTNAAGLLLGNGIYNVVTTRDPVRMYGRYTKFTGSFGPQKAIALIRMEYADGHVELLGTDENWRVKAGPITFSSIYGGEDFDARLVPSGWDEPGFGDATWSPAIIVPGPGGQLKGLSCAAPPIRGFETHQPVSVLHLPDGDQVFDLGQNAAHIPTLRVRGPAGSSVRLLPSELMDAAGRAGQESMGASRWVQIACNYTKATDRVEEWTPKFFYCGCRYYQAQFTPAIKGGELPEIESLAAQAVNSASAPVGEFECSNDLFNRIHKLVYWAQRSNLMSLLTDCPHRERLGWLEEDHLNGPSLRYEFDLAQTYTKIVNDIADSQLPGGLVPNIAPEYTPFRDQGQSDGERNDFGDSPEWSSTFVLAPWQQYEFDGDLELFRQHYAAIKKYVAYLGSRAQGGIVNYGLGDWYDIGPRPPGYSQLTPRGLTATAFYFEDVTIMARVAELVGRPEDARNYRTLAGEIRTAFNERFYSPGNRSYGTGSQCANAIPLVMGLCEPANRAAVLAALVLDVRDRGLTAGDVGYRYLLRALAGAGRSDLIFQINNQSEKPGYGYQLKHGATSLTEAWDANPNSSQNHFMLGQIMEWFYNDLGGIGSDPAGPGFQRIIINPQPVGDVTWANTSYDSIRGKIICHWQRTAGEFHLQVTIPANTTATVFVPVRPGGAVHKSGRMADQSPGVKFLRAENGRQVYAVASGDYDFRAEF